MKKINNIVVFISFVLLFLLSLSNRKIEIKSKPSAKIAILYISTGRYIKFWYPFYKATEHHFLPQYDKTYFLFTDHQNLKLPANVVYVPTAHEPWPYITLKRYHFFINQKEKLKDFDYIFFMNGNLLFTTKIGSEVLPTKGQGLMVTIHPWFRERKELFTYETNPASKAYISPDEGFHYFTGAFNGGTAEAFLEMSETIKEWTDIDLKNKIIPLWHDESMLNRYMIDYMKEKTPLILDYNYVVEDFIHEVPKEIKGILLYKNNKGELNYLRQIK